MPSLNELLATIDSYRDDMIEALGEIIRIPAIGPEGNGEGEFERARYVRDLVEKCGFEDIEMYDALDERVRLRLRPNIVAKKKGDSEQTVWIVSHMDTVPPGDLDAWTSPPFSPKVADGKLYGLGTEDNGQALVASLFAAKALNKLGMRPERTMGLALVADEEVGSEKGIQFLIREGVFGKNDFVYVPDHGEPNGGVVMVAEKHIIWLKVQIKGKQTHASTPERGINATRAANEFASYFTDHMEAKYGALEPMFLPPNSTFEPTKRLPSVGSVNQIPAEDTLFIDCRVLPQYDADEVIETARKIARMFEDRSGAKFSISLEQFTRSGPVSDPESIGYLSLAKAVKEVRGVDVIPRGIGGGTCANWFRLAGIPAYVWETIDDMAHNVNEYAVVDNIVNDSKVFATLFADLCYPKSFK